MASVSEWPEFSFDLEPLSPSALLPTVDPNDTISLLDLNDPMAPTMDLGAMCNDWDLPTSDLAHSDFWDTSTAVENPPSNNGSTEVTAFPEALNFQQPTVNINLQSSQQMQASSVNTRMDGIESGVSQVLHSLARIEQDLAALRADHQRKQDEQAQISATLEKIKKGLDKFFTHVAFEAVAS